MYSGLHQAPSPSPVVARTTSLHRLFLQMEQAEAAAYPLPLACLNSVATSVPIAQILPLPSWDWASWMMDRFLGSRGCGQCWQQGAEIQSTSSSVLGNGSWLFLLLILGLF